MSLHRAPKLFTLIRIRIRLFDFEADPYPAFHSDADTDRAFQNDADQDPASQNDADPNPNICNTAERYCPMRKEAGFQWYHSIGLPFRLSAILAEIFK